MFLKNLSWNCCIIFVFFVSKINFFFSFAKKKWDFKKVLPILEKCHKFSCFETVFFVFLHPCPFCIGNHIFFIAACHGVSPACTCFFIQNSNYATVFCNYCILKFWQNCLVSLKLVYELKSTFRPSTLRNPDYAAKFAKLNFLVKKMDFRP